MSTSELYKTKLNLIAWIQQLSDINLISFLDSLKNSRSKKDWWNELPEKHKDQIIAGLKDAEKGKIISSEQFWKKLKNA